MSSYFIPFVIVNVSHMGRWAYIYNLYAMAAYSYSFLKRISFSIAALLGREGEYADNYN